ncbi:hypothetical protein AWH63_10190 [Marinobacter sp. C18]|uniref:metallophosphoesterase n=1 Tax=Marinobacter sp. C18 TaxID=1772288 RepID=UPI0009489258|nr:metallophosphoesterase [Marinobacter sp. C18]OLF81902.1 hypothetical protein AWH63_10190 [Marinobacter sp. C18]
MSKKLSTVVRNHALCVLSKNTEGRDFFVGDVHGQFDSLMGALDSVDFDREKDRLISVGDLCDRGPDSLKCLELLYEPWFYAVLGNHEDFFLGAFLEDDSDASLGLIRNGGKWILSENHDDLRVLAADVMANLPVAIEVPVMGHRVGVIHAACTSGQWGHFDVDADIWNRRINKSLGDGSERVPGEATVSGIDVVVVGHNVIDSPTIRGNTLNLDCGAARGKAVTLWESCDVLEFARIHQQANRSETVAGESMSSQQALEDLLTDSASSDNGPRN